MSDAEPTIRQGFGSTRGGNFRFEGLKIDGVS